MDKYVRSIVHIDEEKCDGCGLCIPKCEEGALKIVDGKARLVKDIYCDGLGNCLGHCPQDAITIVEREAEPFDEKAVQEHLNSKGCSLTSSTDMHLREDKEEDAELTHWPVQLSLVAPNASFLVEKDLLIAADCVPFAYADFHKNILSGYSLVICCPKLDDTSGYLQKLIEIFKNNRLKSIKVVHMEVGCCYGLPSLVKSALLEADVKIPLEEVIVGVDGSVK